MKASSIRVLQVEDHSNHRWIYSAASSSSVRTAAWIKSSSSLPCLFCHSGLDEIAWRERERGREKEKRRDVNLLTENQEEVSFLSFFLSFSFTTDTYIRVTTRNPWEKVQGIVANKGKISASVLAQTSGSSINQSKEPKSRSLAVLEVQQTFLCKDEFSLFLFLSSLLFSTIFRVLFYSSTFRSFTQIQLLHLIFPPHILSLYLFAFCEKDFGYTVLGQTCKSCVQLIC